MEAKNNGRTPAEQPAPASTGREDDMPTWVVMMRPGMVPVRKGPFRQKEHVENMLRDLYTLHADCQCIVIDMPNDCCPESGIEWIDIYGDKRRKPIRSVVAARELDVEAERRGFQTRMGPQGDDPIPAWWYHLHAAAEALADHGCEANAADVRDIATNLLDQAAQVSTEQAGDVQKEEKSARYAFRLAWECALSDVAFYVAGHCVDGDHHAEIIMGMTMPKMTFRGAAPSPNNSPVGADRRE